MLAVVLTEACEPHEMKVIEMQEPQAKPGWIVVKIKAFGLNRAELALRKYEVNASYIQKPIIPGIECAGIIEDPSDSPFTKGEAVIALMGGMGRSFNGSYAQYARIPTRQVFSVKEPLDWVQLAAIPETFYTAYGSLVEGLQLCDSDILLIHGATSALGLAAIQLAKAMGCNVIGTTRKVERLAFLESVGADLALLDDETLSENIYSHYPQGVTKILELVGAAAVEKTAKLLRKQGIVCVTGQLGGHPKSGFDPIKSIPNGTYLTSFYSNHPTKEVIGEMMRFIEEYQIQPIIGRTFPFSEIGEAHKVMENNGSEGKIVVYLEG